MAGVGEPEGIEDIEAEPEIPQNQNPAFISSLFSTGLTFLQEYGWILVFVLLVLLYIKTKLSPKLEKMKREAEDKRYEKKFDAGTAQKRHEAMEMARIKLQDDHDAKAKEHAEKQKIKEEEKRKQRIEDWENHQEGKGYRSKVKPKEEPTSAEAAKNKPKPRLRQNDYNPLMGGGGPGYRPTRRGGGG